MREETVVSYFANDGTPFKQNKEACIIYENLCVKVKNWLHKGTIMLWDGSESFMNPELLEYTFADKLNYFDWLKKRLQYCYFIRVNSQPGKESWEDLWEFVSKYCPLSESESIKLKQDYIEGDLLAYDVDCRFHNFSLVTRKTTEVYDRLNSSLARFVLSDRYE
jgi:hypothetical protein